MVSPVFVELRASIGEFRAKMAEAQHEIDHLSRKGGSGFDKLAAVGRSALLGIGGAAVAVGTMAVHLADQFETAHAHLETALKNAGSSFDAYRKRIAAVSKTNENLGYTNAQVEEALARLTTATGSPTKALALLATAVNLARLRNLDLADSAVVVGKASNGLLRPLKMLGIDLPIAADGALKAKQASDGLAKAQQHLTDLIARLHAKQSQSRGSTDSLAKASSSLADMQARVADKLGKTLGSTKDVEKAQQRLYDLQGRQATMGVQTVSMRQAEQRAMQAVTDATERLNTHQTLTLGQQQALLNAKDRVAAADARLHTGTQLSVADEQSLAAAKQKVTDAQKRLSAAQVSGAVIIDTVNKKTSGAAKIFGETFAGKLQILEAKSIDLATSLGIWLIPKLATLAEKTLTVVKWFEKHKTITEALAVVIGGALTISMAAYITKLIIANVQSAIFAARTIWVNGAVLIAIGRNWALAASADGAAVSLTAEAAAMGVLALDVVAVTGAFKALSNVKHDVAGFGLNEKVKKYYESDYYKKASPQVKAVLDANRGAIGAGLAATQKGSVWDKATGNVHTGKLEKAMAGLEKALGALKTSPKPLPINIHVTIGAGQITTAVVQQINQQSRRSVSGGLRAE